MIPTEAQEQTALFTWAALQAGKHSELRLMFHVANEGARGAIGGAKQKAQGLKAGVPDIFLPVARGKHHGLFIEMKRTQGGRESILQKQWRDDLTAQGYLSVVCRGWEGAKNTILEYLEGRK